ncbi:MAG: 5-formyltetrahydrofolate cyclo-ligase [Actinomycetota bacterium]|nr:5-formyltetrahydrofolate cyclo-ligase [Actinomycetota bacterium]
MDLVNAKRALRTMMRERRRALSSEQRTQASAAAADHLLTLPELWTARTVALYAALPDEADPAVAVPRLLARGVQPVFPRVADDELEFVAVVGSAGLVPGFRGVREPSGESILPDGIDVVVVPGVAFDASGGRLGQGGGHYDRLLARLPAATVRVGFCLALQLVPSVPRGPRDLSVDVLVTEEGTVRTTAQRPLPEAREDPILPDR